MSFGIDCAVNPSETTKKYELHEMQNIWVRIAILVVAIGRTIVHGSPRVRGGGKPAEWDVYQCDLPVAERIIKNEW